MALAPGSATGASGSTVVSISVVGATNVTASACSGGVAGVTAFDSLGPSDQDRLTGGCVVSFGSSNTTSQLRMGQADGIGKPMWQYTNGTPDNAFDVDGQVMHPIPGSDGEDHFVGDAVAQPDGKIVIAGTCEVATNDNDICVARLLPDGSLDTTFSTDGFVFTRTGAAGQWELGTKIYLQPNGAIRVFGLCDSAAYSVEYCIIQYLSNGALDPSFGTGGIIVGRQSANADNYYGSTQLPDRSYMLFGQCDTGGPTAEDFCFTKLKSDGLVDSNFNGGNRVVIPDGLGAEIAGGEAGSTVTYDSSGRYIATGTCNSTPVTNAQTCIMRLTANGALDPTFAGDGMLELDLSADTEGLSSLHVLPDGKVVGAGICSTVPGGVDACAIRLTSGGVLDTTFDTDGIWTQALYTGGVGDDGFFASELQTDGKLLLGGACTPDGSQNYDYCTVRLLSSGVLDDDFGPDGIVRQALSAGKELGGSLALLPDGKAAIAGTCNDVGVTQFCLSAFDAGPDIENYQDTTNDWDDGTSMFGACLYDVGLGAAKVWNSTQDCPAGDSINWYGVPETADTIATAGLSVTGATATLNFAVKTASGQSPGMYVAPIKFEVVAPNV